MRYRAQLQDLVGALQHGVLEPEQGWAMLQDLKGQRVTDRQERRDALTGLLSDVNAAAYAASSAGDPLPTLLANPVVGQAEQAFGSDALMQALAPYYNTEAPTVPLAPDPTYGMSTLNPQLPADEQASITSAVIAASKKGMALNDVKQAIHSRAQETFGQTYGNLAPLIDKIIESVYVKPELTY